MWIALLQWPTAVGRNGTGPDEGSAEGDALQPEVQQGGIADHLDPLAVGGQPAVEDPATCGSLTSSSSSSMASAASSGATV